MNVSELAIGQEFEISRCKQSIRRLVLLRKSPTGAFVSAEEREDIKSPWIRRKNYISLTTEVEIDPEQKLIDVNRNEKGQLVIPTLEKEKRERKPRKPNKNKKEIVFPKGEFTIPNLAKELHVSTTTIYTIVKERLKKGTMEILRIERKARRGRGTPVYKTK